MRRTKHAGRTDANHTEIVAALRQIGCSVLSLSMLGKGCPDLLVARHGVGNILIEVKDGTKVPSKRKLTDDELRFHGSWLGPIAIVDSVDAALRAVTGQRL